MEYTQFQAQEVPQGKALVSEARANILWRLAKAMIYLSVFLLPIFFLPWTSNFLDFNKQALLLILVFLSLIFWLASSFISNKFEINVSFVNLAVVILFLVSLASAIFSLNSYGSFWGLPLPVSESLLTLLGFVVLYFLIANLFKKDEIVLIFLTLFLSGFLVSLLGIFQLFGKFILPFDFSKTSSFNTVGTQNSLAIFSASLLCLMLPLLFFVKKFFKVILAIFAFVLVASLFLLNFKFAWLAFLVGLVTLFAFGVVNLRKIGQSSFMTVMMTFMVIALIFTFFKFSLPGVPATSLEVSPAQKTELGILKQLPIRDWILGSGPGTFVYDWSRYKSATLNQTIFWATRFPAGASEMLDKTITTGVLGILALFFLIFIFLKKAFQLLIKGMTEGQVKSKISEGAGWFLSLGILASFLCVVVALFFYPANLSIWLIFWLLLGSLAILETEKRKIIAINDSPVKSLTLSFLFVLILVLEIGFSIFYIQRYMAEVRYFQGLKAYQKGNATLADSYISRAINLNAKNDTFYRDIAQVSLTMINETLARNDLAPQEKNSQLQGLVMSAINSANQTTFLNPADVANWSVRGFIYRNMIGTVAGADDWAIKSYEKAITLEPTNPYFYNEMGLIYEAKANVADRDMNIGKALENFEKAVSLKTNYAPASYQMALIYVSQGKTKEAIDNLALTQQTETQNAGLAFQLGVLYYNDNQLDNARAEFELAVTIDQNYSNARYFLGLIYDKQENKPAAISQFEAIEQFNPDNQEVKQILANLRADKPALEGIVPSQPPIQESTPENLSK